MNATACRLQDRELEKGISLIELLIVMAVLSIMAVFAIPGVEGSIDSGRRAAALMDTMGMVDGARSHALSRRLPVAICPSTDQVSCNGTNWEDGWLMFIDDGAGGKARDGDRAALEEILKVGPATNAEVTIRPYNFAGAIVFDEMGMTDGPASLVICDADADSGAKATVLDISRHAQIADSKPTGASCSE